MNSSVPMLHPRGRNRPRPAIVRASVVILGYGIFGWALRILDWAGRGETAIDVYRLFPRFLSFAANPLFQGCLIVLGFVLLWKYAQASAKISHSQLVHPETKLPFEHPVYPAFRRAAWTLAVSVLLAGGVFALFKNPARSYLVSAPSPNDYHIPVPATRAEPSGPTNGRGKHRVIVIPPPSGNSQKRTVPDDVSKAAEPTPSRQSTTVSPAPSTLAPSSVIPSDPVKAVGVINGMRNSLAEVLGKKDTITFLMSWPDDDNSNLAFIGQILSSACRTTPRQCWFVQPTDPRNLDYPPLPQPTRSGLTIHGVDAHSIALVLGRWFTTYSTSSIPKGLNAYKDEGTKELIWVEIGPGSPWRTAN